VRETEHFINEGYGWACRRCLEARGVTGATSNPDASSCSPVDADSSSRAAIGTNSSSNVPALPRFFREGEAEEREARLSGDALARWKDDSRRALVCPRCGVEEEING